MHAPSLESLTSIAEEFVEVMKREVEEGRHSTISEIKRIHGVLEGRLRDDTIISIIGDIHGDYESLTRILADTEDAEIRVFLGDYIDRGPPEGQVNTIYTLLKLYLEGVKIIVLRGNHEPPENLIPYPHDFPMALRILYGDEHHEAYSILFKAWNSMPHALVIKNHLLALHGGPPTIGLDKPLEEYLGSNTSNNKILEEILWNDPTDLDVERMPNPRGAGSLWGPPVTKQALDKINGRLIVRGHEATLNGFKWNHNGRVLTIFSRLGEPYFNEAAAYLHCRISQLNPGNKDCIYLFS